MKGLTMTKDQTVELHNKVTELHKLTNAATSGTVAPDWEKILDVTISILSYVRDHCKLLKMGASQAKEEKKPAPTELSK